MTPKDESILNTLNLLVMLSRSKNLLAVGIPEEEKYMLTVTKQNLIDSDLALPEFANTLHTIATKGYIWHMVIHDENLRTQINDFKNSDQYDKVLTALEELDTPEFLNKINEESAKSFNKLIPKSMNVDYSKINDDSLRASELFLDGLEMVNKMKPDEIGLIFLMPFRDIETLFKKVNNGEKFDDIRDDGFWYDQNKFEFHIDGEIIKTSNRGLPNLSHSVLSYIFSNPNITKVEYEDMADFDTSKGIESYRDAMRYFINKHPKLKHMFSVGLYSTEFSPNKYNEIP